jgi:hypothetical protein
MDINGKMNKFVLEIFVTYIPDYFYVMKFWIFDSVDESELLMFDPVS